MRKAQNKIRIGIIGGGTVGGAMNHLFPNALVHDIDFDKGRASREHINELCSVVFTCVPTNSTKDGSFDYTILEETMEWLNVPIIIIKSTVQPFTTQNLIKKYKKNIVFNPEFLREQTRFKDIEDEARIIIGTDDKKTFEEIRDLYLTVYDHDKIDIIRTTPLIAEFTKLVNNSYFANKVTFCNEIKSILDEAGVDYEEFRRIWLLEPRIPKNHTLVTKKRGYGGRCLPKDLLALINTSKKLGYNPEFLKQIWNSNCRKRKEYREI